MAVKIVNERKERKASPQTAGLIRAVIARCAREAEIGFPFLITVTLTDDAGIKELNAAYREIDAATDVLSFPLVEFQDGMFEPEEYDFNPDTGKVEMGDIVISLERADAQAAEYGHSVEREIAFLTVHGTLHLFGYDHEDAEDEAAMSELTETVLAAAGLPRAPETGGAR